MIYYIRLYIFANMSELYEEPIPPVVYFATFFVAYCIILLSYLISCIENIFI